MTDDDRKRMCISCETLEGLRFTGIYYHCCHKSDSVLCIVVYIVYFYTPFFSFHFCKPFTQCMLLPLSLSPSKIIVAKSVTELVRYLLKQPGVQYVLTAKLSQDSLESFFGKQRMRGGYSDNPNVSTFLYGAQSLRVQGSVAVKPKRGNCKRGHNDECIVINEEPLPKRRRRRLKNH